MQTESNNIIQGLLFLSTKYPNGKIEGGGGSSGEGDRYISFIPREETPLEDTDIEYLESLGWNEYSVDRVEPWYGELTNLKLWRYYTKPLLLYFEDEE